MSEKLLTIVFRGLLVFHKEVDHFEIGVLPAVNHFPRINTIRNGVLEFVHDLQDPSKSPIDPTRPIWRLEVVEPVGGVLTRITAEPFNRKTHQDESDFRWIADLEGEDFYNEDLTPKLDTTKLVPVIHVFNGLFYTRLRTPVLLRTEDQGQAEEFGSIAAVTGCDIYLRGREARLIEEGTDRLIFAFDAERQNTIYEFTNTPLDIMPKAELTPHVHHELAESAVAEHDHHGDGSDVDTSDHFQHYYDLFTDPGVKKFGFKAAGQGPPAPSPALCGSTGLSIRKTPLR